MPRERPQTYIAGEGVITTTRRDRQTQIALRAMTNGMMRAQKLTPRGPARDVLVYLQQVEAEIEADAARTRWQT